MQICAMNFQGKGDMWLRYPFHREPAGISRTEHQSAQSKVQFNQDKHNKYIPVQKSVAKYRLGEMCLDNNIYRKKDFN